MTDRIQRLIERETKGHRWTPGDRVEATGYLIGYGLVIVAILGLVAILGVVLGSLALYVVQLLTG